LDEDKSGAKRIDRRIPWLIVVPFLAITLVLMWGFNTFKFEERKRGEFPIPAGVETVKIVVDVGNLDVVIGGAGKVSYEATTLRATASQELLDRAVAVPFTFTHVDSGDPKTMTIRVSPMPEGFVRLPPTAGTEDDHETPRLFRQLNARMSIPVKIGVIVESSQGNIRVDTRQAPTSVSVGRGSIMLMQIASSLNVSNGDGDTIVADHRGPLGLTGNGLTRVTLADVSGPIHIVNSTGEVALVLPEHCSVDLDAKSLTGRVRNEFGFKSEPLGERGSRVTGKIGGGTHRAHVVAKQGTLTITHGG
jgi:Toastrack DUF4097